VKNNKDIRNLLEKNKIVPENLSPEEDIKIVSTRMKKNEKQLANKSKNKKLLN